MAERMGLNPRYGLPYTPLAGERLQPLGHSPALSRRDTRRATAGAPSIERFRQPCNLTFPAPGGQRPCLRALAFRPKAG